MKRRPCNIQQECAVTKGLLRNEAGGVALVLVVWVVVILVAIVGEFSYSMRTEINIVRNFRAEEEAHQLALAGIEAAKIEILSIERPSDMYVNDEGVLIFNQEDEEPERKEDLGKGTFEYSINDEDGKLNINFATRDQIKYIFLESGVENAEVDTIVDSIIDWRDENDLHMLNGAEEDYYQALPAPYSCKDGPFDSVEELLLVRGMTREILYGSKEEGSGGEEDEKEYTGVFSYLTVTGDGSVNINTAPRLVMETLFGIDMANRVMLDREEGPLPAAIRGGKVASEYFTITSRGVSTDGTIKRTVRAVLHRTGDDIEVLYWNDNFI